MAAKPQFPHTAHAAVTIGPAAGVMPLPFREACLALGIGASTLRRDLAAGAPCAVLGRPGRGGAALYVVEHLAAWRAAHRGRGGHRAPSAPAPSAPGPDVKALAAWVQTLDGVYRGTADPELALTDRELGLIAGSFAAAYEARRAEFPPEIASRIKDPPAVVQWRLSAGRRAANVSRK